jgi:hypothetical protein
VPLAQSADIVVEIGYEVHFLRVNKIVDVFAAAVQDKGMVIRYRWAGLKIGGRLKSDSADQYIDQRIGVDAHAPGIDGGIKAAGFPETGVDVNAAIMRRLDEQLDVHRRTVLSHFIAYHLADLDFAVIDR